jgi:hypothetical protein
LKSFSLGDACRHQRIESRRQAGHEGMVERRLRLLALLPLYRLDHAAHAEQRIEPRPLESGDGFRPLRYGLCLAEGRLVQPDFRLTGLALDPQADCDIAPRQLLLGESPGSDLESLESRREAQAQIEIAAVDATGLPMPARLRVRAIGASETSHALKAHRRSLAALATSIPTHAAYSRVAQPRHGKGPSLVKTFS